jgi:hypothetical protein
LWPAERGYSASTISRLTILVVRHHACPLAGSQSQVVPSGHGTVCQVPVLGGFSLAKSIIIGAAIRCRRCRITGIRRAPAAADLASGTGITVTTGANGVIKGKGTFNVQCCIHPWMRTTVQIQ